MGYTESPTKPAVLPEPLDVDLHVIDETPDDITVAIRLPRRAIHENALAVMAILENAAGGGFKPRGRVLAGVHVSGTKSWLKSPVFAATAAAMAAVGAFAAAPHVAVALKGPPITYSDQWLLSETVPVDGALKLQFTTHRRRLCKTDVDRVIMKMPERTAVWRVRLNGIGHAVTDAPITRTNEIPLPKGLTVGQRYAFQGTAFSDCGSDADQHIANTPLLEFVVVENQPPPHDP